MSTTPDGDPRSPGAAGSALRVACAAVSGKLYAGRISRDGSTFVGTPIDVTSDVLAALLDYCPIGQQRVIRANGKAVYTLQVLPPPNASGSATPNQGGSRGI